MTPLHYSKLFQSYKHIPCIYCRTLGRRYGVHCSRLRCQNFVLHLHGFQNNENVSFRNFLSGRYLNIQNGSRHRCTYRYCSCAGCRRRCCRRSRRCRCCRRCCRCRCRSRRGRRRCRCCCRCRSRRCASFTFFYFYRIGSAVYGYAVLFH